MSQYYYENRFDLVDDQKGLGGLGVADHTIRTTAIGHRINIQKSVAFLYTNNEISERKCNPPQKKISFKITSKNKIK